VGSNTEDVNLAGGVLDDEERVEPGEVDGIDVSWPPASLKPATNGSGRGVAGKYNPWRAEVVLTGHAQTSRRRTTR
jgi:hypothetical protein